MGAALVLARVPTPAVARRPGAARLARWLKDRGVRRSQELAEKVMEAAKNQRRELRAAKAALVSDMLKTREGIAAVDSRLEELLAERPEW